MRVNLKAVGVVVFVTASALGGAVLGAIIGAIYAPFKIYEIVKGKDQTDEPYVDDEI